MNIVNGNCKQELGRGVKGIGERSQLSNAGIFYIFYIIYTYIFYIKAYNTQHL